MTDKTGSPRITDISFPSPMSLVSTRSRLVKRGLDLAAIIETKGTISPHLKETESSQCGTGKFGDYSGMKVLIADTDNELAGSMIDVIKMCLPGIHVMVVNDGSKVLDIIDRYLPYLLILEIMLPKNRGVEVLRELSRCKDDLPVLVMSGSLDSKEQAARFAGMTVDLIEFLSKPFKLSEVARVVTKLVDGYFEQEVTHLFSTLRKISAAIHADPGNGVLYYRQGRLIEKRLRIWASPFTRAHADLQNLSTTWINMRASAKSFKAKRVQIIHLLYREAIWAVSKAIELSPNSPTSHTLYALRAGLYARGFTLGGNAYSGQIVHLFRSKASRVIGAQRRCDFYLSELFLLVKRERIFLMDSPLRVIL